MNDLQKLMLWRLNLRLPMQYRSYGSDNAWQPWRYNRDQTPAELAGIFDRQIVELRIPPDDPV